MSETGSYKSFSSNQLIDQNANAGFFSSVFNLMNAILGAGIVSLPYAISNLGYVLFTVLLLLVAGVAIFSAELLLQVSKTLKSTSYEIIAEKSCGFFGKFYTCLVIYLHTLFAICGFMFMVRYEMPPLIRGIFDIENSFFYSPFPPNPLMGSFAGL